MNGPSQLEGPNHWLSGHWGFLEIENSFDNLNPGISGQNLDEWSKSA